MVDVERWIEQARAGDEAVLGRLLESYRNYLSLLARIQLGRYLQAKVDASDVVQEAFLDATRYFPGFQGHAEGQFVDWLRTILSGILANTLRRYLGTQARDVRREQQLAQDAEQSTAALARLLVDPQASPSQEVLRREQSVLAADALARLPEDYQAVIILRQLEGLSFAQVAERMGRSVDSVEKLWIRGVTQLRRLLNSGEMAC